MQGSLYIYRVKSTIVSVRQSVSNVSAIFVFMVLSLNLIFDHPHTHKKNEYF